MKIRGDFVTNSSSVSYILTTKKEIADLWIRQFPTSGQSQLLKFVKDQIERNGQKIQICGEELYSMIIKFSTDGDAVSLDEYTKGKSVNETDFSKLSDEEMWGIIYWIIMEGEMKNLLAGIGATMIETF